jgi:hypothetical protein
MRNLYKSSKTEDAIVRTLTAFNNINHRSYRDLSDKLDSVKGVVETKGNYFEFIPNYTQRVVRDLFQVNKLLGYKRVNFLDVGSGNGNILSLAKALNATWWTTGIEYDEEYKKISSNNIIYYTKYMDALKYTKYANHGVIYFYQPIATEDLMNKLLDIIDEQISKNTIIMAYDASHKVAKKVQTLWQPVFRKHRNIFIKK